MTLISISQLDTIRNIEVCIKKYINFSIPRFLTREVSILIMESGSSEEAFSKIKGYLENISQQSMINNKKLILNINKFFLDPRLVNALWLSGVEIDYDNLNLEKRPLLGEAWNDEYETSKIKRRPLSHLLEEGIVIKINVEALKYKHANSSIKGLPLAHYYGDDRLVKISNFSNSKISHLIHDLFDHMCFFSELKKGRLFSDTFRDKVGRPHERDIFSRESELIASVSYEWRFYLQNRDLFKLSLNDDYIKSIIVETFGVLAKSYICKVKYLNERNISVYHIYYNVICELYEQIRKVGTIKLINCEGRIDGDITQMLDNDYLKIVIDMLYLATKKGVAFKRILLDTYSYIESLLHMSLDSKLIEYQVRVNLKTLLNYSKKNTKYNSILKAFFNL